MQRLRSLISENLANAFSRRTWTPDRIAAALLILVLALAAILRLLPTGKGLPYLHYWDEPLVATTALNMMKTGDLNPGFFHYGSLAVYAQLGVDVAHYLYLMGTDPLPFPVVSGHFGHDEVELGAIETYFETGWLWEVSHPSFYLWNRGFNAVLGTFTVLLTFLLGRALAGRKVGLLAAALLAVQGFHIERSAMANPEVAMTLAALAAVYFSFAFAERPRPWTLLAALACCGLAASAKYNGVYCAVAPLAALVVAGRGGGVPRWLWGAVPVVPALAFLATTPYALLDLPDFLAQAGFEIYHYTARGHGAVSVEPGWQHLALQTKRIAGHFGVLPLLAAVGGGVLLLRRRGGLVVLVCPLFYFFYMATTRAAFPRNLLVIYPLLALAAAFLLVELARRRRFAAAVVTLLVAAHLGHLLGREASSGWEIRNRRETRSQAIDAIGELAREMGSSARVGLAEELRFHRLDLARLDVEYEVAPHLELVCGAARYDVVATGVRYLGLWSHQARRQAFRLNDAALTVERREIGGPGDGRNVTRVDGLSENPVVALHLTRRRGELLPEICGPSADG